MTEIFLTVNRSTVRSWAELPLSKFPFNPSDLQKSFVKYKASTSGSGYCRVSSVFFIKISVKPQQHLCACVCVWLSLGWTEILFHALKWCWSFPNWSHSISVLGNLWISPWLFVHLWVIFHNCCVLMALTWLPCRQFIIFCYFSLPSLSLSVSLPSSGPECCSFRYWNA